ncbi:phosphotransferase [Glycomyces arizonensis]|uniref:phosphotransferase n=1 Tax=Glycomyces arizonensis TaxID=256035 RepID=UPI0003FD7ABA|nr:phosphotransferase [Glycomyces arizonensis]
MSRFGTPVPYTATAVRPAYGTLPAAVRERIAEELGGEPTTARLAGGGFTGGFAARVRSESGAELFVKAAGPRLPYVLAPYRKEAQINPALPAGIPAPRLHFSHDVEDWIVLGFEAVNGGGVDLPMTPTDLDLMLDAWAAAAELLTPAPRSLLEAGVERRPIDDMLRKFTGVAAGAEEPFPVPPPLEGRIDELAALDARIDEAIRADAAMHFDLRPDNMIVGAEQAWICDWNWMGVHAPWFDTACFLVAAHGDGHDAEALFWRHPTAAGVADEQLDIALAAIAGYYLAQARQDLIEGVSPYIRKHQRWSGLAAADWLARRRGYLK